MISVNICFLAVCTLEASDRTGGDVDQFIDEEASVEAVPLP